MNISVCTASMSSMTYALKAQRALLNASIPCRVIALDKDKAKKGCAYGIEFSCHQLENVKRVFKSNRILSRHYYNGASEI